MLENSTSPNKQEHVTCGKACDVYSRVTGYYTPTRGWNEAKQEELRERLMYAVADIPNHTVSRIAVNQ
jgi:hypothetical protein